MKPSIKKQPISGPKKSQSKMTPVRATAKAEFVLFNTDKEEFLAQVEDKGPELNILYWATHPEDALIFASPDQAVEEAKHIVKNKGYTLDICRLIRESDQIKLELVFFLKPSDPADNLQGQPVH